MQRARDEDWSFLDAVVAGVFTVPGDGGVDFPAVLAALPGYAGWLVVEAEPDSEKAPPAAYARLGSANRSRYATAAGRSEAPPVGEKWVITGHTRWSPSQ